MLEELHSRSTMSALCKLIPTVAKTRFVQMLSDRGLSTRLMGTQYNFEAFKILVSDQVEALIACADEVATEESHQAKQKVAGAVPKVVSSAGTVNVGMKMVPHGG